MGEVLRGALQVVRDRGAVRRATNRLRRPVEGADHRLDVAVGGGLVARQRHVVGVDPAQQVPRLVRGPHQVVGATLRPHQDGVEVRVVHHLDAAVGEHRGQRAGPGVHPLGDRPQAGRPVVDRVHRRHHGQQHLGGADVRRRLLAADVLLAGLQGEPVRGGADGVDRHPDEPPGQRPLQARAHRHVPGVRPAEAHRHAEPLRGADGDVRAHLARRSAAASAPAGRRPPSPGRRGRAPPRRRATGRARRRSRRGTAAAPRTSRRPAAPPRCRARRRRGPGRPSGCGRRRGSAAAPRCRRPGRRRRTACARPGASAWRPRPPRWPRRASRRSAVVMPVRSDTAVWKFSSASSRPWLISGWYGVYAVYQDGFSSTLRRDHAGRVRAVVPQPDHRAAHRVGRGDRAQLGQHLGLADGLGQVEPLGPRDRARDGGLGERVQGVVAEPAQHVLDLALARTDVAGGEVVGEVGVLDVAGRLVGGHEGGSLRRPRRPGGTCWPPPLSPVLGSRAACPVRSWRLRGSGEFAPSAPRRTHHRWVAGTLPHGVERRAEPTPARG